MEYLFRNILLFITICLFSKDSAAQGLSFLEEKKLYYDSVYNVAVSTGDELMLAEAHYLYGKYDGSKRLYKESLIQFFKALKLYEKHPPSFEHGRCLQYIGNTYIFLSNPELAWQHHIAAEKIYKAANSKKGILRMQDSYLELKLRFPEYFKKNKPTLPVVENNEFMSQTDSLGLNLALFKAQELIEVENYKKAISLLKPFENTTKYHLKPTDYLPLKVSIAFCYTRDKQLKIAKEKLLEARAILEKNNFELGEIAISYHEVAEELYRKLNDWKKSHYHLKVLSDIENKKLFDDRNGSISELTVAYETEKKNNQILQQEKNLQMQQNWLIAFGLGITVLSILGVIFYILYKKNKRLSLENRMLLKEQNHRVKNNLQVLSSLLKLQARRVKDEIAKNQLNESQMRIESISLMHERLHKENSDAHLNYEEYLNELINAILISFNLEKNVKIDLKILFDDLRTEHTLYLSLIINELITNTCKYAFGSTEKPEIGIELKKTAKDAIQLYFRDNGSGRQMDNNKGFGTKLIAMQVEQLNGEFYYYNDHGTHFKMTFPI